MLEFDPMGREILGSFQKIVGRIGCLVLILVWIPAGCGSADPSKGFHIVFDPDQTLGADDNGSGNNNGDDPNPDPTSTAPPTNSPPKFPVNPDNSTVTVTPDTDVPADGETDAVITVVLLNDNAQPVADIQTNFSINAGTECSVAGPTDSGTTGVATGWVHCSTPVIVTVSVSITTADGSLPLSDHPTVEFVTSPGP